MKPILKIRPRNGFALVVTISMMVLLTVIVVATLSLSTVTLRAVDKDSAQAVARANARLALMIAIGQLQKEAGPDQRVTGTADIKGNEQNPQWTGVWKAGKNIGESTPTWLVSGANPDPGVSLDDANSAVLASPPESDRSRKPIRAEYVKVIGRQLDGRYAYWVGDEGTKVRVDVANPDERGSELQFRERVGRSQSPSEPGFSAFDSKHKKTWAGFDSDYTGAIDRKTLVSMGTVALAAKDSGDLNREDIPKYYFNDLTTGGFGLPVNVRDGGMKKDLSLILDTSQQNQSFVENFLGGRPLRNTVAQAYIYTFPNANSDKFTLSPTITKSYTKGFVGPNWGILYNYARMWETVSGNESPMIGLLPRVDSDLRQTSWAPYREANKGTQYMEDIQHVNSGLSPVMSMAQIGFSLRTEVVGTTPPPARSPFYQLHLMVKPVVGLWNPYNVHIRTAYYQLEWALAPILQINSSITSATINKITNGSSTVEYQTAPSIKIWLRDYWGVDGGAFPTDGGQGGSYFRLRTPAVEFQPGEFRLFSVDGTPTSMKDNNALVATMNPTGAYTVTPNGYADSGTALNKSRYIGYPSGTRLTVTEASLQDTHPRHVGSTKIRYPGIGLRAANTWFTLKAGATANYETHLNRYTDLWNGGKDGTASVNIPESVMPVPDRQKQSFVVDILTAPQHIATWRFYTRNSTESSGDQGLRGWIDANPRVMSNNFRMDGSTNQPGNFQGWYFSSNLLGARSDPSFGDGSGGNRGLVAEGGNMASTMPDGVPTAGRWQGLTGPASTSSEGGLSHVIVYDVPQAPLTSVGQFQHANLSRYPFEPGFVVGNSYANPRIPLNSIINSDFGGLGFPVVDIAYEANERVWDTVFFSTLAPDYKGGGTSFDRTFDRNALLLRQKSLPNPRMVYTELPGDTSIDKIINDAGGNAPAAIATRIMIEGAFNVNSTSKTAWKAVLSTMDGSELPVINPYDKGSAVKWETPKGIRFSRFNHPIMAAGFSGTGRDPSFWQGWRELDDDELDSLAEAIVEEVKDRGPFKSMAEFVNRNPYSSKTSHQYKGALQAAIDRSINNKLGEDVGLVAGNPSGSSYSAAASGESQAAGHAAYLLQGDILQCLAPIMQVRSDYFRIRTCGEALDKTGKVVARVWCEAFIQRMPNYIDPADAPEAPFDKPTATDINAKDDLRSDMNKTFGRQMKMVSFRWLNPNEI